MKRSYSFVVACIALWVAASCNHIAKYPIGPATSRTDSNLYGKWTIQEDSDKNNVLSIWKYTDYQYRLTFKSKSMPIRRYTDINAFISPVGKARFLNVSFSDSGVTGYLFVRLIDINKTHDSLVAAVVTDTAMSSLGRSAQVRQRIADNLGNKAFYGDTLHLYKLKSNTAPTSK